MSTFAHDGALPPLPVPDLTQTCEALPLLVEPLVDDTALAATKKALAEFCAQGGPGEKLQNALLARKAAMPGNASWLRPLWDDMYLAWRGTLPLEMNYFFRFREERWGGEKALPRLVLTLAALCAKLGARELEPESSKAGFLAMDQAASCLYTRIPCAGADHLLPVPLSARPQIAVSCGGHWFVVTLADEAGNPAGEEALAAAFAAVREQAHSLPTAPPVAAFTGTRREDAALVRAQLAASLQNRLSFAALERCLFAVCLDAPAKSEQDFCFSLLCGDAASRWFDKSLQIIASQDGRLGANFEHAGCDAAIWVYLLSQADKLLTQNDAAGDAAGAAEQGASAHFGLPLFHLAWEVADDTAARLHAFRAELAGRLEGLLCVCRDMPALAREHLKSFKTSPDAFLQIAFQAAQYSLFGRLRSSYEAVAVRGFAEGRTECARGCTAGALALARALEEGADDARLLALYRAAEAEHVGRLKRCQQGLGVERHMSGLAAVHALHGKALGLDSPPALFTDPGWQTLKHDALSTSGIGAPFIRFFGFGPVVEDGLGIGYAPGAEGTGLVVSALAKANLSPTAFFAAFERAAACIGELLLKAE